MMTRHNFTAQDFAVTVLVELTERDCSQHLSHFGSLCLLEEQEITAATLLDWGAVPIPSERQAAFLLVEIEGWLADFYGSDCTINI